MRAGRPNRRACAENNTDSATIGTTSATDDPAITMSPNLVLDCPASFRIGRMIPRLVADRVTAMSSGERTRPPPDKTEPDDDRDAEREREPEQRP